MKKFFLTVVTFMALVFSAQAATLSFSPESLSLTSGASISVDLVVSGLETADLTAFDIDVVFDDSVLEFDDYTLYDGLGDISAYEAEDYSYGEYETGIINLCEFSYLDDSEFSFQDDTFVLATMTFTALSDGTSSLNIDYADLSTVPIPSTLGLLALGLLNFVGLVRRKKA